MGRIRKIFFRIIDLSPGWRSGVFILVLGALAFLPFRTIELTPKFSICSKILGEYCYSVGITRGVASLLRGDFTGMFGYNPLAFPVFLAMICIIIYDLKRYLIHVRE